MFYFQFWIQGAFSLLFVLGTNKNTCLGAPEFHQECLLKMGSNCTNTTTIEACRGSSRALPNEGCSFRKKVKFCSAIANSTWEPIIPSIDQKYARQNNFLVVNNIQESDTGTYRYISTQQDSIKRCCVILVVDKCEIKTKSSGDRVELRCGVKNVKRKQQDRTTVWVFKNSSSGIISRLTNNNGKIIYSFNKDNFSGSLNASLFRTLVLMKASKSYSGNYTCIVKHREGREKYSFVLTITDNPSIPRSTAIEPSWTSPTLRRYSSVPTVVSVSNRMSTKKESTAVPTTKQRTTTQPNTKENMLNLTEKKPKNTPSTTHSNPGTAVTQITEERTIVVSKMDWGEKTTRSVGAIANGAFLICICSILSQLYFVSYDQIMYALEVP